MPVFSIRGTFSIRRKGLVREIEVPSCLTQLWLEEVGQQLICQIELYAYLAARFEYKDWFYNRGVIAWLDNESARFAASKGTAQSPSLTAMARVIQQLEVQYPTVMWVERVCSYSNPSDKPSRGQCAAAAKLFQATHDQQKVSLGEKTIKSVEARLPKTCFPWSTIYTKAKEAGAQPARVQGRFLSNGGNNPRKQSLQR